LFLFIIRTQNFLLDRFAARPPGCNCPDDFVGDNCQFASSSSTTRVEQNVHTSATYTVVAFTILIILVVAMLYRRQKRQGRQNSCNDDVTRKDVDLADDPALSDHPVEADQISFEYDNQNDSDNLSCASSKTGSTTSSKRNHLRKSKKKKFSTMDRTVVDFLDDGSSHTEGRNDVADGIMKTNQTRWPNIIKNESASIFNEIDLGDDYGVNLVV
jgi:cbb3-type cytochrome oxidase subunit 3